MYIAAGILGFLVVLILIVIIACCCMCKRRRRQRDKFVQLEELQADVMKPPTPPRKKRSKSKTEESDKASDPSYWEKRREEIRQKYGKHSKKRANQKDSDPFGSLP